MTPNLFFFATLGVLGGANSAEQLTLGIFLDQVGRQNGVRGRARKRSIDQEVDVLRNRILCGFVGRALPPIFVLA